MRIVMALTVPFLVVAARQSPEAGHSTDRTIAVSSEDRDMNAAIAKARATLPAFYRRWKHPAKGETQFCLKVKITAGDDTEHFWLVDLKGVPGKVSGVINNDPEFVHTVSLGQRIPIPNEHISDWMYVRKGKIVGNLTARALFRHMPPDELRKLKNLFENP